MDGGPRVWGSEERTKLRFTNMEVNVGELGHGTLGQLGSWLDSPRRFAW